MSDTDVVMDYTLQGIPLGHPFIQSSVEKCMNFPFQESDVLIVGYPKSGNTWLQDMSWLIMNNADTEGATARTIMSRAPLMEMQMPGKAPFVDSLSEQQGPRLMNTHLSEVFLNNALEKGHPKVIVAMRNPKDLVVSYFHFYNTRPTRAYADFDQFFTDFMEGKLLFGSYFDFCARWWQHRHDDNYLFLTYEGMKADHHGTVTALAQFLGKDLSIEQIQTIVDFTSFNVMKNRPGAKIAKHEESSNNVSDGESPGQNRGKIGSEGFFRKGQIGEWMGKLSAEQSQQIDERVQETFDPIDLKFIYTM